MSRLINTTTMTVDGVTDVADWYVSEGGREQAARDQFDGTAGTVLGRKVYEGLAAYWTEQSGELARDLLATGLVDELRFWLHPAIWSEGGRPYEGDKIRMRHLESRSFDSGVTLLRYEPVSG
jgi:hypothetical protein